MREIKFRIPMYRDKDNSFSYFSYWGRIDHHGNSVLDGSSFTSPGQSNVCHAEGEEQFTGLRDKNGREIYEGDVYLSTYRAGGAGSIRGQNKERIKHIVRWYNKGGWIGDRIEKGKGLGCCHPDCSLGEDIEVIGNIHENPELLRENS